MADNTSPGVVVHPLLDGLDQELVWTIFRLMAMTVLPSLVLLATATLLVPWPELAAVEAAAATVVVVSGADEETSARHRRRTPGRRRRSRPLRRRR